MRAHNWKPRLVALLGISVLALSGCGGPGQAGEATGDDPATGEPIRIGYINQEQSAMGSFPPLREGAEAAIAYVNGDAGGVGGRPIELIQCITDGSPESAQQCGDKMIREKVAAVLSGIDFSGPAATAILAPAGIPYLPAYPIQGSDFNGENVFALLGGSAAQFSGMATALSNEGVDSVAIIVNDTPAGLAGAGILEAELAKLGITEVIQVPDSPTAVDFTAAVTLADRNNPDAMVTLYAPPGCGQVLLAQRALGVDATLMFSSACLTPELVSGAGKGLEGTRIIQELLPPEVHPDDPDVKVLTAAMEKYKEISLDRLSTDHVIGFAVAMDLVDALGRAGAEPTGASISAALRAPGGGRGFMDSGYVCDGSVLPDFPAVCNASVRVMTWAGGKQAEVSPDWILPGAR